MQQVDQALAAGVQKAKVARTPESGVERDGNASDHLPRQAVGIRRMNSSLDRQDNRSRFTPKRCWPRCWTASSSKPLRKLYRPNGNRIFTATATDSALNVRPIRPCAKYRRPSAQVTAGWWTWTCKPLRKRGVSVREAWNTSKSAHGPWRPSKTPALAIALPWRYLNNLGLPSLAAR